MDMDPNSTDDEYYSGYYDHLINECLSVIANTVLPYQKVFKTSWNGAVGKNIVKMPDDYLSFSLEALPKRIAPDGEIHYNADIYVINSKDVMLSEPGSYEIWYNAMYPDVQEGELDWLPRNVAMLIPPYVASQLLMGEDLQRAVLLKNEFETMLARLDNNKPLVPYSYNNSSGWTY